MRQATQLEARVVHVAIVAIPWAIICAFWVFWGWSFSRQGEL